jgi:ubiquinone/menaquinone biosynthesis C-methylase UbiE
MSADLNAVFAEEAAAAIARIVGVDSPHYPLQYDFALGRLDEGRRVGDYLASMLGRDRTLRVLDVGAGNGGVSIGFKSAASSVVHALDIIPNTVLRAVQRRTGTTITQTVGSAHDLPYRSESFDVVLCLETLEHIPNPPAMGREIMRVLRPGGICMVMTPARVRFIFRRDPHYNVWGLLLLPDNAQRFVVTRLLKLANEYVYDVTHTFWSLRGIARLFPGHSRIEPLFNNPRPHNKLWYRFRDLLWDRIIIVK